MDVPRRNGSRLSNRTGELGVAYRVDSGIYWLWNVGWHERRGFILCWDLISLVGSAILVSLMTSDTRRGIIGPILVANGLAFGTAASEDPEWALLINYASLGSEFTTVDHPSPRYWLLWPGVLCMIVVSFTGLSPLFSACILLIMDYRTWLSVAYLLAQQSNGLERNRGCMPAILASADEENATVTQCARERKTACERSGIAKGLGQDLDVAPSSHYSALSSLFGHECPI